MEYYSRFERNPFVHDQDDSTTTPETAAESPLSGDNMTLPDAPSPKKRRSEGKRAVTMPVSDGDVYPPADSWAWRKYGQKPIKGSPYPRGYYRCSSSKGCPARKQVERSQKDPTLVVITYACQHDHHIPTTKHSQPTTITTVIPAKFPPEELAVFANQPDLEPDSIDFAEFVADFGYFSKITPVILESPSLPICLEPNTALMFTTGDDDDDNDDLFADLGELPGCSLVFR